MEKGYYTPEELLQYATEQEMLLELFLAATNNQFGYQHCSVEGKIVCLDDGKYVFRFKEGTFGDDQTEDVELDADVIKRDDPLLGVECDAELVLHHDEYRLIIAYRHKDDGFSSAKKAREALATELADMLLLDFIEACGINTRGRLKVACETAVKMHEEWAKMPETIQMAEKSGKAIRVQRNRR